MVQTSTFVVPAGCRAAATASGAYLCSAAGPALPDMDKVGSKGGGSEKEGVRAAAAVHGMTAGNEGASEGAGRPVFAHALRLAQSSPAAAAAGEG